MKRCAAPGRGPLRSSSPSLSPKFAPAQNAFPCAARTSARHSASASKVSNAVAISPISAASKKLFGGRLISTSATWPVFSTPMSLNAVMRHSLRFHFPWDETIEALGDQRVHHRYAVAGLVHDHRVEINRRNLLGVVIDEVRQPPHQHGKRLNIGRCLAAIAAEHVGALEAAD